MQIHRVRGNDLTDALERAREAHGENAVVLSHEAVDGGGVTVSVTQAAQDRESQRKLHPAGPDPSGIREPGLRDVVDRLRAAGTSPELADNVVEVLREGGSQGAFAIDSAATALSNHFRAMPSPPSGGGPRVIVFVGPTGSGKSTSLGKLAMRLKRAGRKIAIATLDTARPAGTDFVRHVADNLGVSFTPVRYREDLRSLLAKSSDCDAILLDTAGRSPSNHDRLGQLRTVLTENLSDAVMSTYLVVSASTGREALAEVHRGFASLQPEALVVTKLDETRRTSVPLEFSIEVNLPIAFLCNGQELERDLYLATPDRMADLVLGGRVR